MQPLSSRVNGRSSLPGCGCWAAPWAACKRWAAPATWRAPPIRSSSACSLRSLPSALTAGGAGQSPCPAGCWIRPASGFDGLAGVGLVLITLALAMFVLPRTGAGPRNSQQPAGRTWRMARRPAMQMLIGLRFLPTIYYGMSGILIPLAINEAGRQQNHGRALRHGQPHHRLGRATAGGRSADRFGHRWPPIVGCGALIVASLGLAIFSDQLWGVITFGILETAAAGVRCSSRSSRTACRAPSTAAFRAAARHVERRHDRRRVAGRR